MEEEKDNAKYMDMIKFDPNFIEGGYIDEDGFYIQPDGSYFDADGYFFNANGYDENGGYYDEEGVYRNADYEEVDEEAEDEANAHIDYLEECFRTMSEKTKLKATIAGLLDTVNEEQLKKELDSKKIIYSSIKIEKEENSKTAYLEIDDVKSAHELLLLHGTQFLGDYVDIDYPDLTTEPPETIGTIDFQVEKGESKKEEEKKEVKKEAKKEDTKKKYFLDDDVKIG